MKCWYALYTKPYKEHHVSSVLEGRGFETYLPTIQVRREGQKSTKPFFSCYLFVRLDPAAAFSSVRWTSGLRRVVSFGGQPAVVPNQVISLIRQRLAGMRGPDHPERRFKAGERVFIKDGRFKDFEAVFDRALSNRDRAMVLLDLLGQWTRCEVDVSCLEKL